MSIPTTGPRGVRFRSRLEARWAAFFTLLGWAWEYEPELGLDGWIPDFAIVMGGGLLVEVKPVTRLDKFTEHMGRINGSGAEMPCWLAGAALAFTQQDDPVVGYLGWPNVHGVWGWRHAQFGENLKSLVDAVNPVEFEVAQRLWVRASNALQWRKR